MIQATYKGIEIEMKLHQFAHGWKCDYTPIKHPGRTQTIHHGDEEFLTMDPAVESALKGSSRGDRSGLVTHLSCRAVPQDLSFYSMNRLVIERVYPSMRW